MWLWELSRSKWLIGALLPGSKKVTTVSVNVLTPTASSSLNGIAAKAINEGLSEVQLHVCFEAGHDGFWLARFLIDGGIDTTVLDASPGPHLHLADW
jgi:transposase